MQPYIICFESIPKLALAPLIILVFGLGLTSKVAIAIALTFVISTLTTYAGVKALDPDGEKLFYSLGATRWQVFRKLVVPFCLPWIISVLRVNIGLGAHRRDRRRIHLVAARPRPRHPLCRPDLRHRARLGRGARALDARRHHVRGGVVARKRAAQGHAAIANIHQQEVVMNRRKFLGTTAAAGVALVAKPYVARAAKHELLVAEPVHSTGYLPMYIAMAKDYFAEADIEVKIVTIETGAGHTNAVLSGQAFAFIGGPEHNAFAKAKGAELRAVVHCVDRGNVYFCAAKGSEPKDRDLADLLQGQDDRRRRLRRHAELDHPLSAEEVEPRRQERTSRWSKCQFGDAGGGQGAAAPKIGVTTEPMITQGIKHRALERAVLQRAEGARPLRLFHHQHPPRTRSRRSRRWCAASCAA